jgi:hypothetical protein
MSEPPSVPEQRPQHDESAHGGVEISGGDVRAAHDFVAGDVNVAGDSISGQTVTVQRGYSAPEVQRLLLIVGGLVILTAAIFFALGAAASAVVVATLNRPLREGSSLQAAGSMQEKIRQLNSLQAGQRFQVQFSEDEVSSYFRFVLAPQLGISNGKARFMNVPGQIAFGGNLDRMGGIPFVAQLNVTTTETPLQLETAWLKLLPSPEGSSVGYVTATWAAQDLTQQLNAALFGRVRFTDMGQNGGGAGAQPANGAVLVLVGVAK